MRTVEDARPYNKFDIVNKKRLRLQPFLLFLFCSVRAILLKICVARCLANFSKGSRVGAEGVILFSSAYSVRQSARSRLKRRNKKRVSLFCDTLYFKIFFRVAPNERLILFPPFVLCVLLSLYLTRKRLIFLAAVFSNGSLLSSSLFMCL